MIDITFITPTLNSEKYIRECISSVSKLKNDFKIEHLFFDGGSIDQTTNIIKEKRKKLNYIKLIKTKKSMLKINKEAFELAKGVYIFFLMSDDYIESKTFIKFKEQIKKNNISLFLFSYCSVHNNKFKKYIINKKYPLWSNFIFHGSFFSAFLIDKNLFKDCKLFEDRRIYYANDRYASYLLTYLYRPKIINDVIVFQRIHPSSLTMSKSSIVIKRYIEEHFIIISKLKMLTINSEQIRVLNVWLLYENIRSIYYFSNKSFLRLVKLLSIKFNLFKLLFPLIKIKFTILKE